MLLYKLCPRDWLAREFRTNCGEIRDKIPWNLGQSIMKFRTNYRKTRNKLPWNLGPTSVVNCRTYCLQIRGRVLWNSGSWYCGQNYRKLRDELLRNSGQTVIKIRTNSCEIQDTLSGDSGQPICEIRARYIQDKLPWNSEQNYSEIQDKPSWNSGQTDKFHRKLSQSQRENPFRR